jgi:hypothetical protein
MSFHLTKLAMNADFKDDPVAKNVMIALCWSFFDGATHGTLNEERICRRTAYKKRTVQDALARLKTEPQKDAAAAPFAKTKKSKGKDYAWGLIQINYFGVGSGTSPKYTINEARLETMQFPEQLSLRLTSLRAVEPNKKGAAAASFAENGKNEQKDAAAAFFSGSKGAAAAKKGAAAASMSCNSHSSYNNTHDNGENSPPTEVEVCVEGQPEKPRSRFPLKQWFAYAKTQPNIKNPMAFAATRFQTTEHDNVLALHLEIEQQNKATAQKAPTDCPVCRGTGWEYIAGKGVKPCACRVQAQAQ